MADEPDGVNEALHASTRVALTVGGLIAERMMRAREQAHREAEAASQQQAREVANRLDAERAAARAQLAPVAQDDWWERAGPQDIGLAWETARAWEDADPDASRTVEHMRDELRRRYAIDTDSLDADPAAVQDALERRERALRLAAEAREQARVDDAIAVPLMVGANAADREQERDRVALDGGPDDRDRGEALYDSADRRRDLADSLEHVADEETVEARVVADTNQGRPAEDAVAEGPRRTPAARRARGTSGPTRSPARRTERGR
jgi:colicin import membrane protein